MHCLQPIISFPEGEPNNAGGCEDRIEYLSGDGTFAWNDISFSAEKGYICQCKYAYLCRDFNINVFILCLNTGLLIIVFFSDVGMKISKNIQKIVRTFV